jgi:hypothetical protein
MIAHGPAVAPPEASTVQYNDRNSIDPHIATLFCKPSPKPVAAADHDRSVAVPHPCSMRQQQQQQQPDDVALAAGGSHVSNGDDDDHVWIKHRRELISYAGAGGALITAAPITVAASPIDISSLIGGLDAAAADSVYSSAGVLQSCSAPSHGDHQQPSAAAYHINQLHEFQYLVQGSSSAYNSPPPSPWPSAAPAPWPSLCLGCNPDIESAGGIISPCPRSECHCLQPRSVLTELYIKSVGSTNPNHYEISRI